MSKIQLKISVVRLICRLCFRRALNISKNRSRVEEKEGKEYSDNGSQTAGVLGTLKMRQTRLLLL